MALMTWTFSPEPVDRPESAALRRDYYGDVAGRYWNRPATEAEIDEGLKDDGAELLTPPTGRFLVARYGGVPAGCGGFRLLDAERAELTRIYLRPAFRGRGGVGPLLSALEADARALGARRMVLDTRLDLVEARAAYVRHGYGEIPAYSSGPYSQIWYGKDL
ncbi:MULTISPECIES: GNAT family N-acetyltransferase [unclassified Streptomyces]|uniref:GNAT family N-acetyltransferase n=1 Tax=unclassified Streptomyces TaxID=2593676 RepID=UPI001660D2DB|nr:MULTISPECIES: GNAT family N-acetyltransferase [unclassified Streptomyces]MBD0707961.1 GNAT family N-acetyltransferase [Streptomyces sp. CBMA291]MBD0715945.1 GNAT family N-acetyltransferase [Streptomyces sp. CBMA370]